MTDIPATEGQLKVLCWESDTCHELSLLYSEVSIRMRITKPGGTHDRQMSTQTYKYKG